MMWLRRLAIVAAVVTCGHTNAAEQDPHGIFNDAMTGEFGRIIRIQALLEHVCGMPALANDMGGQSQKALAPLMPPVDATGPDEWRQMAGTIYNDSLQYREGYAAGVRRGLDMLPHAEPSPTAQLCRSTIEDAQRWPGR